MAPTTFQVLTPEDVEHFMTNGFVRIPQVLSPEQVSAFTADVWTRLGYSPTDKSTWLSDRVNMPFHRRVELQEFAPKAWGAICDLLGGEERVNPESSSWSDGFICNFGSEQWDEMYRRYLAKEEGVANPNDPKKLDNWHVDGDFFVHFLDSKEQGLLVIPLFSDIAPSGGGTMISPDGIGKLAKWMKDHPRGVMPRMRPVDWPEDAEEFANLDWYIKTIQTCDDFREMTGKSGDVILMHPLMLHSASRNLLRTHRIITNPPVALSEPFNFDRADPSEYSLVEKKTLKELAKIEGDPSLESGLKGWKITGERKLIVPARLKLFAEMKAKEEARLRGENVGANTEAGTIRDDPGKHLVDSN